MDGAVSILRYNSGGLCFRRHDCIHRHHHERCHTSQPISNPRSRHWRIASARLLRKIAFFHPILLMMAANYLERRIQSSLVSDPADGRLAGKHDQEFSPICVLRSPTHPIYVSKHGDALIQTILLALMGKIKAPRPNDSVLEGYESAL